MKNNNQNLQYYIDKYEDEEDKKLEGGFQKIKKKNNGGFKQKRFEKESRFRQKEFEIVRN